MDVFIGDIVPPKALEPTPVSRLYCWTVVAGVALAPFFGPYVDAGWGQLFYEAALIISGLILALIYYSTTQRFV